MVVSEQSILTYLRALAASRPDKRLLGDDARWLDAQTALSLVERLGAAFRALGLTGGAFAALKASRTAAAALVMWGLRAAGAVAVLAEPRQEIARTLSDAETPLPVTAVIEQTGPTAFRVSRLNETDAPDKTPAVWACISPKRRPICSRSV